MQRDDISLFVDYGVFLLLLCVSTSVAVYSRLSGPKQKTKHDFVFASGSATSIPMIAMMMSIARGFLGVKSLLGYPSELFYRGSGMWETLYGMTIAFPLVCIFFVPVYYNLQTTSVYQYLDMRFKSRLIRCLASGTYVTRGLMKLGVTVFIPCVALKTTIGLPYWTSISSIVLVSLVFTIMGGLKTAIMADVTQLLVMIGCTLIIIFYGFVDNGGVLPVVKSNFQGGRLQFFNFDTDPTLRVTTISATVGQLFMSLSIFGCQQNFVQRYCSMKSQAQVRRTLMGNMPVMIVVFSLSWIAGMVLFTTYSDCDPMKLGLIQDIDEIVIYYVKDKFKFIPGFLGLIMACLYNGALNLCISNFNSISTVLWEDFVSQLPSMKGLPDSQQLVIIKIIAVVCAVIVGGFACLVALLSGVIESSLLVTSATSGPLLGVFILAMFFPSANWKGAGVGMVVSHLVVLWIAINNRLVINKPKEPFLPTTTSGCNDYFPFNTTIFPPMDNVHVSSSSSSTDGDWLESLYSVTFMYYSIMGTALTVIVGVIVSYIACSDEDELVFEEKLIHPWAIKISNWLPGSKRTYFQSRLHSPSSSTQTKEQEVDNIETNPKKNFQK